MKFCKSFIAVLLALSISLVLPACSGKSSGNTDDSKNPVSQEALESRSKEGLEALVKADVEKMKLREALGNESIYPDFYIGMKEREANGVTKREAVKSTKAGILQREAKYWYAAGHDAKLTDQEAAAKLEERIKELTAAADNDEIDAAYQSAGVTLEEVIRSDQVLYKKLDTIEVLSKKIEEKYMGGHLTDEEVLDWDKYWKSCEKKMLKEYRKTEACDRLEKALMNAEKVYPAGIKQIEKIQAVDLEI